MIRKVDQAVVSIPSSAENHAESGDDDEYHHRRSDDRRHGGKEPRNGQGKEAGEDDYDDEGNRYERHAESAGRTQKKANPCFHNLLLCVGCLTVMNSFIDFLEGGQYVILRRRHAAERNAGRFFDLGPASVFCVLFVGHPAEHND